MRNSHIFETAIEIQGLFKRFYLADGTPIMFKYHHRKTGSPRIVIPDLIRDLKLLQVFIITDPEINSE